MSVFLNYAVSSGEGACAACGGEMTEGQEIYTLVREKRPWLPEDHDDQRWPAVQWHKSCDQGSLSAASAEDQRTTHVRKMRWRSRTSGVMSADIIQFPGDPEDDWQPMIGHDFDCEKDLHGWSICSCTERAQ